VAAYEVLAEYGYPKEAAALEIYASGEAADIFAAMARTGIFEQMRYHSPTSQFGVLSRRADATGSSEALRAHMRKALDHIRNGGFAREWKDEEHAGYPRFHELRKQIAEHPLNAADAAVRELLSRRSAAVVNRA
jgi:ketol-acid reductoisomerase